MEMDMNVIGEEHLDIEETRKELNTNFATYHFIEENIK